MVAKLCRKTRAVGEHPRGTTPAGRPWGATGQVYCARRMYIQWDNPYMRSRRLHAPRAPPPPERRREASPRAPLPGSAAAPLPDVFIFDTWISVRWGVGMNG